MDLNDQTNYSETTTPEEARKILANLSETGFSGKTRDLAFLLGRNADEIHHILNYDEEVDEDLMVTIHRLAGEFGLQKRAIRSE